MRRTARKGLLATIAEFGLAVWQDYTRRREIDSDPTAQVVPWANARMVAFCYDQRAGELREQAFELAADGRFDDAAVYERVADEWAEAAEAWRTWADSL
jgi:hypothetical protein